MRAFASSERFLRFSGAAQMRANTSLFSVAALREFGAHRFEPSARLPRLVDDLVSDCLRLRWR